MKTDYITAKERTSLNRRDQPIKKTPLWWDVIMIIATCVLISAIAGHEFWIN